VAKDLRHFLAEAEPAAVVARLVDSRFEIPAILESLEMQGRFPTVLFERALDTRGEISEFRVLANVFADRERIASLFNCASGEVPSEYLRRAASRRPPRTLAPGEEARVKRHRYIGDAVRLTRLPVVTHHEKDAGPYITSGAVILKDPETGIVNGAIQRLQLKGDCKLGLFMLPGGHNHQIFEKYRALGRNAPVAVVIGHHPAFYLAMQYKGTLDESEYEVAGGLLGEPLELIPAETQPGLEVPADAEIVIEGEIPFDRLEPEGPFGEYTHYYSPQQRSHVIEVSGLLHREQPIFQDIFCCHRDHHLLEGVVLESQLLEALRASHPGVQALSLPPSGCCQFFCYVALDKRSDSEPREVIDAVLRTSIWIKYVVAVDPDVNVFDEGEVLWAVATRARASADFSLFMDGGPETGMDPMARDGAPERGGLDATRPLDGSYPDRVAVPREILSRVSLAEYGL
jgi:2,5-furandicarboxylate decarboxylase 1